jgi:mgtE-like transporter
MSLLAGALMTVFTPIFDTNPWILALFPPVLTVRGGIGGIFSGNLSTMLHLGLIKPRVRGNTPLFKSLISSVLVITTIDTLILGAVSFILNLVSGNADSDMWIIFLSVPTIACMLAVSVSVPLTSLLAIQTYNRGLDPDILVYPILASMNDIIVTVFYVATIYLVLLQGVYFGFLIVLFLVILLGVSFIVYSNLGDSFFLKTIKEGSFIVVVSSLFGSVNGVLLSRLSGYISVTPGLITLYPALTNALGNIGSIIGSKTTTDMALGYARSFIEELRDAGESIIEVELPAFLMHIVFASLSFIIAGSSTPGVSFTKLLGVALVTNLLSFLVISVFALFAAYRAFQLGLNPDNIVIPSITMLSDTTATLAITPAVMLVGILGL